MIPALQTVYHTKSFLSTAGRFRGCAPADGGDGEPPQITVQGSLPCFPCSVHGNGQFIPVITRCDPRKPLPFIGSDIPPDHLPLRLHDQHFPGNEPRLTHPMSKSKDHTTARAALALGGNAMAELARTVAIARPQ